MPYLTFISYDTIGGVLWVTSFLFGGYYFGNLMIVKDNFSFLIFGVILVSLLPGIIAYIQSKRDPKGM